VDRLYNEFNKLSQQKMKRINCIACLLFGIISNVSGQNQGFSKTYLHGTYEDTRGIIQTSDGNYLVTGLEMVP